MKDEFAVFGVCSDFGDRGRGLQEFRPWYTMLIGGYGKTFLELGDKLHEGRGHASRDAAQVGIGSCGISHYNAIPLTRRLMAQIPEGSRRRLLDLGCGNALYLAEFCKASPEIEALGVEPSPEGVAAARALIHREGLEHRVRVVCSGAVEFFASPSDFTPDFVVLGFVLHEILGQVGEEAVLDLLRRLVTRYPEVHIVVIEVGAQACECPTVTCSARARYVSPASGTGCIGAAGGGATDGRAGASLVGGAWQVIIASTPPPRSARDRSDDTSADDGTA